MAEGTQIDILSAVKLYGRNLMGFIRRRVKTDADAEDILQDVWFQFSAIVNSVPIEQTSAWLYKVARNKILDKQKKKKESLLDDMGYDSGDGDELGFKEILLSDNSDPESEYFRNIFWEQLFRALDELPEEQRQVFIWHELDALSFQEIALQTGEKQNTLITRKRYAVLHLRNRLQQLYYDILDK